MADEVKHGRTALTMVAVGVFVVFLPALLAVCEGALFGTHHVEDVFRAIGLHGVLDTIYEHTLGWLF